MEFGPVENNFNMSEESVNVERQSPEQDPGRPTRLGFEHIVPGADFSGSETDRHPDIPAFDLNQQSMAGYRRQAAARRKGPGQRKEVAPTSSMIERTDRKESGLRHLLGEEAHPLVSAIVRRDIEKLCQGEMIFTH